MKYVCIEGCVGVGKTTVATQLAGAVRDSVLLLEDYGIHPFLKDFYSDPRYTFETELNFLLIHYHQLLKMMAGSCPILISDYFFNKDELFADANVMNEKELDIFRDLYEYLRSQLIKPDIVICLTGSTDMIYQRVINRNRIEERNISYEYLNKINLYYKKFFADWKAEYKTIEINMNVHDFVKNPTLIEGVLKKVMSFIDPQ